MNPGRVRSGPRTGLKHKLSAPQNAVFYGSGVGQSDRGVDVVSRTVPKSSIDQTRIGYAVPISRRATNKFVAGEGGGV